MTNEISATERFALPMTLIFTFEISDARFLTIYSDGFILLSQHFIIYISKHDCLDMLQVSALFKMVLSEF